MESAVRSRQEATKAPSEAEIKAAMANSLSAFLAQETGCSEPVAAKLCKIVLNGENGFVRNFSEERILQLLENWQRSHIPSETAVAAERTIVSYKTKLETQSQRRETLSDDTKIEMLTRLGIFPFQSVCIDGKVCGCDNPHPGNGIMAGDIIDLYEQQYTYEQHGVYRSGWYYKREIGKFSVGGFDGSRAIILPFPGAKKDKNKIQSTSRNVIPDSERLVGSGLPAKIISDFTNEDYSKEIFNWYSDSSGLVNIPADFSDEQLEEFAALVVQYRKLIRQYAEQCGQFTKTPTYSTTEARGFSYYATYPDNNDFFTKPLLQISLASFDIGALKKAIDQLMHRNECYPQILKLMKAKNWEALKQRFPEGRVNL